MQAQGPGSETVISSSGGVIATLAQQVMAVPDSGIYSLFEAIQNCSITRFVYNSNGDVALQSYNDVSFLKAQDKALISYR